MNFDYYSVLHDAINNIVAGLKEVFLSKPMIIIYAGLIVSAIASFFIKHISYNCFRLTGDSKRKAKKKSNLLADFLSLIDSFRGK
ncbi:hypothetical protein NE683_12245 [Bariatricus massiliensis]|uniref:Uncharacterized protein n=1 Tax=Bariatricus massiliensis TaxID=1745713 RepID=A0ABS8DH07_9FIRM|nr:hypothetical protein [Bariatricus massiliensis]MCB7306165.1 hypothetical protein [Bariatricus massiliensis]MCB7375243.1 hypothetical protein [Bariatricus massiliensis]MCB7387703.1 hypothetical protein [Bariatricus massiliensis]MCB7411864.1 hypothetical protein [Bariatricus massiliensis]MCQ5254001.1 hypothetical protein [Bariatricus massiliensis]